MTLIEWLLVVISIMAIIALLPEFLATSVILFGGIFASLYFAIRTMMSYVAFVIVKLTARK